jgi:hypothetical protein
MKKNFFISIAFAAITLAGCKKEQVWSQKFVGVYTGSANCGTGDVAGDIIVSAASDNTLTLTCITTCDGSLISYDCTETGDRSFSVSGYCFGYINGTGSLSEDGKEIIINAGSCSAHGTK